MYDSIQYVYNRPTYRIGCRIEQSPDFSLESLKFFPSDYGTSKHACYLTNRRRNHRLDGMSQDSPNRGQSYLRAHLRRVRCRAQDRWGVQRIHL